MVSPAITPSTRVHMYIAGNTPKLDRDVLRQIRVPIDACYNLLSSRPQKDAIPLWTEAHAIYTKLALTNVDAFAENYFTVKQFEVLTWAQKQVAIEADLRVRKQPLKPRSTENLANLKTLLGEIDYSLQVLAVNVGIKATTEQVKNMCFAQDVGRSHVYRAVARA